MPRRAFTLVELLILSAALVPVFLILISLFPFAYGINGQARELATAQELAATQLEHLRGQEFGTLAPYSLTQGNFKVDVALAPHPALQNPVRQQLATVTVRWGRARTLEVQTLLMKWAPP